MQPLILPPQTQPFTDGDKCHRGYYLPFQSLWDAANQGFGLTQHGTRAERQALAVDGILDGSLWIETDTGLVYQWRAPSLAWVYTAGVMIGTFAARLSGLGINDTGVLYRCTDTFAIYEWGGAAWNLFTQIYQRTQSQLSALAGTLGATDAGLMVNVTDYGHLLQWGGSGWQWGPGEAGSGQLMAFAVAPTGNGWHVCDGTTGVSYLKSDGTLGTVNLPNVTGGSGAYMKLGSSYVNTITGAQNPTSSTPTFTGTLDTTSGPAGTTNVTTGGTAVASAVHTHTVTPTGTVSAPTISLPGDPIANFEALLYFRQ